ncbi:MAG TPA: urea ABC transporter permease subunit UrtB [Candidatus Sulfotelmatobacter sp.]|nr:urea ABC transporter permease subunit UrtB [Candidatus Sulfotelmatobacter sp.]
MTESTLVAGQIFNGISVASILLLAALGLALSFGLMRVINMAHGEMLMMGGYVSYLAMSGLGKTVGFPVGLLGAFVVTALVGAFLEVTLIRRLYGRPLDTLLATWGVSLVLQQAARSIFGPVGVEVTAPDWLSGSLAVGGSALTGFAIPAVRVFIIVLAALVLGGVAYVFARTPAGLYVRAVHQNRAMAEALGTNTRLVDLAVFSLGTGIAGLAGAALALIAPVTPTVGQSYIVYAFLVVIVGGLGSLTGTLLAALLVGLFSALAQIFTSVSFADVLLLVAVIAFIQFRPRGIVTRSSRALEAEG